MFPMVAEAGAAMPFSDTPDDLIPVGEVSLATLPAAARRHVSERIAEYRELEHRAGVPVSPSLPLAYPAEIGLEDEPSRPAR